MPIRLFFSHSSRDSEISKALVHLFQYATKLNDDEIRCTSIVPYNLAAGANTDAVLQDELRSSTLVIGLLTRESADSYYVMAELGARWGAKSDFMLLRSSNFSFSGFSGPLANLSISSVDSKPALLKLAREAAAFFGKKPSQTQRLNLLIKRVLRHNRTLSASPLEIQSALWGSGTTYVEVVSQLRRVIKDFTIKSIIGGDVTGGDPTPGISKTLKIQYTIHGVAKTKDIAEGDILELP